MCRKILTHAEDHGFSCQALITLGGWASIMQALAGVERGLLRLVEHVGMHKKPAEATEGDFEAARLQLGMAYLTAEVYFALFRAKMRAAHLESSLPLLNLSSRGSKPCADPLEAMSLTAQTELVILAASMAPGAVPDRPASDATRSEAVDRMVTSFRMLHAHTRAKFGVTPDSLRALVVPTYFDSWIDEMQNDKHQLRNSVWATAGRIHAIVSKHSLFGGGDFNYMLKRIGKVPTKRGYLRTEHKEAAAAEYDVLAELPKALVAKSKEAGLNIYRAARLRRNAAIVSLLLLALRQRNIRSCALTLNLVWKPITLKIAHDHRLDMPTASGPNGTSTRSATF